MYAVFYILEFSDGGNIEGSLWHQGTKDDCEMVANAIPAILYQGNRPDAKSSVYVMPTNQIPEDLAAALGIKPSIPDES